MLAGSGLFLLHSMINFQRFKINKYPRKQRMLFIDIHRSLYTIVFRILIIKIF